MDPIIPGLILPQVDQRDAQYGTFFASGPMGDSKDWRNELPPYINQGWYPFCNAYAHYALVHAINKVEDGRLPIISRINLFFAGGGGRAGSSLEGLAEHLRLQGAVFESRKNTPNKNEYSWDTWEQLQAYGADVTEPALKEGMVNRINNHSWVNPTNVSECINALEYSPLVLALPIHRNYYDAMNGWEPVSNPVWHAPLGVKRKADGAWLIFDSIAGVPNFDGFRELPADYPVGFAKSYRDLPDNWQDMQDLTVEQLYPIAYEHYGLPRLPLTEEQRLATRLRALVESYPDPGIRTIAGKYWIILVNAALYGGYSYVVKGPDGKDYFAFRDKGSDLANALYHYRRNGVFPFDFNKRRNEQ